MTEEEKTEWQGFGQKPPESITTEMPKMRVNPDVGPSQRIKSLYGNFYPFKDQFMFYKEALVMVDDFGAGETFSWFFPETEVQYVLRGKAELTYSLGATSHTEQKTMTVEEGDCYIIPPAARVTFKVSPEGPLRRLEMVVPFPPRAWGMQRPEAIEQLR